MTNSEAFDTARDRARRNGRAQLVWKDAKGNFRTSGTTAAAVKKALLAVGTKGKFYEIWPSGITMNINWFMGCRMIKNAKYGC